MNKAILLLSILLSTSLNCSLTERINQSKEQLSELRTKVLKGEKLNTKEHCGWCEYNCDYHCAIEKSPANYIQVAV